MLRSMFESCQESKSKSSRNKEKHNFLSLFVSVWDDGYELEKKYKWTICTTLLW